MTSSAAGDASRDDAGPRLRRATHQSAETQRSALARFFGATPLSVDGQQWFSDALGEITVGALLSRLGPEWVVLHTLPSAELFVADSGRRADQAGTGEINDIDHLVIGPAGVFTINTRNHAGQDIWVEGRTVIVAGNPFPHIRDSEHGVGRAERLLADVRGDTTVVRGVLVIIEPRTLAIRDMPRDLQVLASADLLDWLADQPVVLAPDEARRIADAAKKAGTWWQGHDLVGAQSPLAGFDDLRRRVDRARMLRELWVGTFTIVVIVTAAALGAMTIMNLLPAMAAH
ncbi:MAG: hypothetical protein QOG18_397 [Microbacteriaceae bacterium]|jgi:hypothetical protein|nr:hypothetical protein [Microbacteriaceae bacterium]MDQ1525784.1 hypothetical protein [Microbacteriaceae bacterium]